MLTTPKYFHLPFVKREKLSQDAYSFYFDKKGQNFYFLPGQHVRMSLALKEPDERGHSRFFSIASSPLEKDYLMITARIIQSPFKKAMLELKRGVKVEFFGPIGIFYLDEKETRPAVFLAGGIGITPFNSMITYAASKRLSLPIILFVSFSTIKDVIFKEELSKISQKNPNIKIVYTITQAEKSKTGWQGETGRISQSLLKKYLLNVLEPLYYVAGPPPMVKDMVEMVKSLGVPQTQIRKEEFIGY